MKIFARCEVDLVPVLKMTASCFLQLVAARAEVGVTTTWTLAILLLPVAVTLKVEKE
jgi:hypothetical protein